MGSGEPWPVDSGAVLAVQDEQPAVPGRQAEHHVAGEGGVGGDDRADQAAPAAGRELDHLRRCPGSRMIVLTGPNASTSCGSAPVRVVGPQQQRRR